MHVLRVVTWNAEGMFVEGSRTRRATPQDAIKAIKKLDADIVFVPEFGNTAYSSDAVMTSLHALGYQTVPYSYEQSHLGSYGAAFLTRLPLRSHTLHHFKNTGRTFIEVTVELPSGKDILRVFGLHLDDREEAMRLEQVAQLLPLINAAHVGETIVLGDLNAMSNRSIMARLLVAKPASILGMRLPSNLLKSMSERVGQMARGTTIAALLVGTELHDLDPGHHLTISAKQAGLEWAPKIRLAKIDWIFGTQNVSTIKYKVLPDVGSDHRPVQASICIK